MIIRPIKKNDLESFYKLSLTSSLGITNLPKNKSLLEKKIEDSLAGFSKKITTPSGEKYIFVLEDSETGEICGTSGILSKTALHEPLYYYKIEKEPLLQNPKGTEILKAVAYKNEPSEIGGLYLNKKMRGQNLGKLLSLSRFLFIAAFKERFESSIFAEIRGVIGEDQTCVFWEGLGKHFFSKNYEELMKIREKGRSFIKEILPTYPIYLSLLPKNVQEVIGKPHEKSEAALKMLEDQGFSFNQEIDIFDGGPRLFAKTATIKTIKESCVGKVSKIEEKNPEIQNTCLISNERIDFLASFASLSFYEDETIGIHLKIANALQLNVGDKIRYFKM